LHPEPDRKNRELNLPRHQYILLFVLIAAIGFLSAEIFSERTDIAHAAEEDLTVNMFDENGDVLQFGEVSIFDADDSSGDRVRGESAGSDGVAVFDNIAGSLIAGNVLIIATQLNGYAMFATTSIPATVNMSASGLPSVDLTVLDKDGSPLDDAQISFGARAGRFPV